MVTFEQARMLGLLGFDLETDYYYVLCNGVDLLLESNQINGSMRDSAQLIVPAPDLYLVQEWFREYKNIEIKISTNDGCSWFSVLYQLRPEYKLISDSLNTYEDYKQALRIGINKAFNYI